MHRLLFGFLFIALACQTSIDNGASENYELDFSIANAPDGMAYLIGYFETQTFQLDSAAVVGNRVVFSGDSLLPAGLYYLFLNEQKYFQFLLDKDQNFTMRTDYIDMVNAMQVNGSVDNELFYQNLKFELEQQPKFEALKKDLVSVSTEMKTAAQKEQERLVNLRKEHLAAIYTSHPESFFTIFKRAGQNPDPADVRNEDGSVNTSLQLEIYKKDYWANVDFSVPGLLRTPVVSNKANRYFSELIVQHPDSITKEADIIMEMVDAYPDYYKFFANWIALKYEPTNTPLMDPEAVFTHMVQKYFTYDKAFWSDSVEVYALQQRASEMAGSLVGNKALDISTTDINGQQRSIMEMSADYIIVYLFNPTCDHCMIETPKLVSFYKTWKNRGVDVYSIGVDTNEAEWRAYCEENQLPFVCVFDPTYASIYGKYYVDITPEIYVLNPERRIIAKNLKVDQIQIVIDRDRASR